MIDAYTLIFKTTKEIMNAFGDTMSYIKLNKHKLLVTRKGRKTIDELFNFTMDFMERNSIYSKETMKALRELSDTVEKLAVIRVFWRGMRNRVIKTIPKTKSKR